MDALIFAIAVAVVVTLLCEGVLWMLFRRRIQPLIFPHELDTSYFRFLSIQHMQIAILLHTIFSIICVVLFCLYLW